MSKMIAVLLAFTGLLTGCSSGELSIQGSSAPPEANTGYNRISAEKAKEMMVESTEYILLDVRTEAEFIEKRIDGAVLIPDYEISVRAEEELPDKHALILLYCRSGRRSALAAKDLVKMGYTKVYDFGGIIDWPYDTVSGGR